MPMSMCMYMHMCACDPFGRALWGRLCGHVHVYVHVHVRALWGRLCGPTPRALLGPGDSRVNGIRDTARMCTRSADGRAGGSGGEECAAHRERIDHGVRRLCAGGQQPS